MEEGRGKEGTENWEGEGGKMNKGKGKEEGKEGKEKEEGKGTGKEARGRKGRWKGERERYGRGQVTSIEMYFDLVSLAHSHPPSHNISSTSGQPH